MSEEKTEAIDAAKAVLVQEREKRMQAFGAEMKALTEKYNCRLATTITFPGGEQVALDSFLVAMGINVEVGLRVVGGGES